MTMDTQTVEQLTPILSAIKRKRLGVTDVGVQSGNSLRQRIAEWKSERKARNGQNNQQGGQGLPLLTPPHPLNHQVIDPGEGTLAPSSGMNRNYAPAARKNSGTLQERQNDLTRNLPPINIEQVPLDEFTKRQASQFQRIGYRR